MSKPADFICSVTDWSRDPLLSHRPSAVPLDHHCPAVRYERRDLRCLSTANRELTGEYVDDLHRTAANTLRAVDPHSVVTQKAGQLAGVGLRPHREELTN